MMNILVAIVLGSVIGFIFTEVVDVVDDSSLDYFE